MTLPLANLPLGSPSSAAIAAVPAHATNATANACDWLEGGVRYRVRALDWSDMARHAAYQRLRADVFVHLMRWPIPLEVDGRECDRYDVGGGQAISVHCVYGVDETGEEQLLGGIRIFTLRTWDDAMLTHEFASMIPPAIMAQLQARYDATQVIELTRLCLQVQTQGASSQSPVTSSLPSLQVDHLVARDLCYAALINHAYETERDYAVAILDSLALRAMERSHFIFEQLFAVHLDQPGGYALVVFDLGASLRNVYDRDGLLRAKRIAALCPPGAVAWLPTSADR